jgi:flavin reductase (DIM6/NTAB) family NADH-FMN oxidoreductase RutF
MTFPTALLRHYQAPLVAVTAATGAAAGRRSGQIAVFTQRASVVPERPRLLAPLWKGNLTRDLVEASGACAVHLLRVGQQELVYHLGLQSGHAVDKLATLDHRTGSTGAPLLRDCLGFFECRVVNQMDGGDMTVFLLDIVSAEVNGDDPPLTLPLFRSQLTPAWQARFETFSEQQAARYGPLMDGIDGAGG